MDLQADILLFIWCLLTAGHINQELTPSEPVISDIRDHTCLLGLQLV